MKEDMWVQGPIRSNAKIIGILEQGIRRKGILEDDVALQRATDSMSCHGLVGDNFCSSVDGTFWHRVLILNPEEGAVVFVALPAPGEESNIAVYRAKNTSEHVIKQVLEELSQALDKQ